MRMGKLLYSVDGEHFEELGHVTDIELSAEELRNVKFVQEKKLISQFFEEVSLDTQKYAFGIEDTLRALSMGAAETVIVWENLPHTRFTLRNAAGEEIVKYVILKDSTAEDYESSDAHLRDPDTGAELEVIESVPAVEWFAEHYKSFGATLEFVTDKSEEGSQFCKGFGGIGALLRYKVDFMAFEADEADDGDMAPLDDIENPL